MFKPKSPEELEDAAIRDAVNTAVSLQLRNLKRSATNYILTSITPEVESARHAGREVDIDKFFMRAMTLARHWGNRVTEGFNE